MIHRQWYKLLYTMEANDNKNRDVDQIKILAASKAVPSNSDRNTYAMVLRKKKSSTGILHSRKQ